MAYVINRPDRDAMERLLDRNGFSAAGTILRLAWLEGLSREEIVGLTWPDISIEKQEIVLKDRRVPFYGDMEACIRERMRQHGRISPYVVISEKNQDAMRPQSVSRVVRKELDTEGMTEVRLIDLRHDFVIRLLETENWATVARISGLSAAIIQSVYSPYIRVRETSKPVSAGDDEYRIWCILQEQKETIVGLALALRWYMNVQQTEMLNMTWDNVDFDANILHLPSRDVKLNGTVRAQLEQERNRRKPDDDPHVLLTENSRKPMDGPFLSRQIRTVLIRGGVEHIPFRNFQRSTEKDAEKKKITELAKQKPGIMRRDVVAALGISNNAAHLRLREMADNGELVRVLRKYYLPETAIPQKKRKSSHSQPEEIPEDCSDK